MRRILSVAAVAIVALSSSASAQRGAASAKPSPELGMDAGIGFQTGTPSRTTINIPAQQLRAGFYITPVISIEPTLRYNRSASSGTSNSSYSIGTGLLYHFSASRAANQFYVRPFLSLVGSTNDNGTTSTSASDMAFGAGVGMKMPLRPQIAARFEGNVSSMNDVNTIGLLAGLSFYTR